MRRRSFLKAGVGLATIPAILGANAVPAEKKFQKGASPWPLCLNTSTIRPTPLKDKIRVAAAAGYDGIELWIDELEKYEAEGGDLKALGAEIRNRGLFVPNVVGLWDSIPADRDAWEKSLVATRRRMRMSAAVGSSALSN